MLKNANLYGGVVYSQKVLLKLVEKGLTREEAYKIVQKHALTALNGGNFKIGLSEENLLTQEELEECFDEKAYLNNIQIIYEKFDLK
jgi:adenylosuccinate lyase